jgi:hypothetical protein
MLTRGSKAHGGVKRSTRSEVACDAPSIIEEYTEHSRKVNKISLVLTLAPNRSQQPVWFVPATIRDN